jgi:hypothetical protein
MAYVIAEPSIGTKDTACVDAKHPEDEDHPTHFRLRPSCGKTHSRTETENGGLSPRIHGVSRSQPP